VMYCYGEIQFSLVGFFLFIIFIFVIIWKGYLWLFVHLLFHEAQSIYVKYITLNNEFKSHAMSFYNSLFSLPVFVLNILRTNEANESFPLLLSFDSSFWVFFFFFCFVLFDLFGLIY
jgi:hypothetical protein